MLQVQNVVIEGIDGEKLAKRLKTENPEHFENLVRMHLSFILDLNSCDYLFEPEIGDNNTGCSSGSSFVKQVKKKGLITPKIFGKKIQKDVYSSPQLQSQSNTSSQRTDSQGILLTDDLLKQIGKLINVLNDDDHLKNEGIFRRTGSLNRQQDLRQLLQNSNECLLIDEETFNAHDYASVFKSYLAELAEPLLTDQYFIVYTQFADFFQKLKEKNHLLCGIQLVNQLLPQLNRLLFKDLIELLHKTICFSHVNKMTADNLATLFTPHLMCPRRLTPEQLHIASQNLTKVVSYMISNASQLFAVPSQLLLDLKAYWTSKHHSSTAVNTVFSFVDREQSAKASVSDSTEMALAQLYAHIQSMPESAKKRKLIKQFNKENGHGTPLMSKKSSNRAKIGDLFRKRILKVSNEKNCKKRSVLSEHNTCDVTPAKSEIETKPSFIKRIKLDTSNNIIITPNRFEDETIKTHIVLRKSLSESNLSDFTNTNTIEKSTKRILNDTLMTPRSRKPVLLKSTLNICRSLTLKQSNFKKSKSDTNLFRNYDRYFNKFERTNSTTVTTNELSSNESLTSTFREYLTSRLSSNSHIIEDLSFSSRTGDFVNGGDDYDHDNVGESYNFSSDNILLMEESEMSESLLNCLNGELPSELISPEQSTSFATKTTCLSCKQVNFKKFTETSF